MGFIVFSIVRAALAPVEYETEMVSRADLEKTISVTGQIHSKQTAVVSFPVTGTLSELNFEVGEYVEEGQVLARLRASDIVRSLTQAQAEYNAALTALSNESLQRDDRVSENNQDLRDTYASAPSVFSDIYVYAQQAQNTFESFIDSDGDRVQDDLDDSIQGDKWIDGINNSVWPNRKALKKLTTLLANFPIGASDETVDETLAQVRPELLTIRTGLVALQSALYQVDEDDIAAATLSAYRSDVTDAISDINAALSAEFELGNDIANQGETNSFNFNDTQANYNSQLATVNVKEAALSRAQGDLSDTVLRAPISGIIARKSFEIGERVSAGSEVYYIIDADNLEIRANVPEVDIGDLSSAQSIFAIFDALSFDEEFGLSLERIDPDQTNIDGVVYYRSIFTINDLDERFKPGMSADVTVVVDSKENVLSIPRRVVAGQNGTATVRVLTENNEVEEREVKLGLRGDFLVEVLSGLSEGENIILSERE
ncbi:MAG: efflux RND transporter periplasmic adaptor subunit [Candidatus Paceibacterota bacterium]